MERSYSIMHPMNFISIFLDFFFCTFSHLISDYRRYEKLSVNIYQLKARHNFLKECLEEKVVPSSLCWVRKLNIETPFPDVAAIQLKSEISNLKEELNHKYFKIRQVRRNLRSQIHDLQVQNDFIKNCY